MLFVPDNGVSGMSMSGDDKAVTRPTRLLITVDIYDGFRLSPLAILRFVLLICVYSAHYAALNEFYVLLTLI